MIMGTAQKQNIAVQHRIWNRNQKPVVWNFETWFEDQKAHFEEKNAKVEIIGECVFIQWPGQKWKGFSILEFEDEYKTAYLRQKNAA